MANLSVTGARVQLGVSATLQNTLNDAVIASAAMGSSTIANLTLQSGADANQANRFWQRKDQALANGASDIIDIYGMDGIDVGAGVGKDAVGQDITMEEVVAIAIKCESGDGQLEIIPDPANGWSPIGSHTVATGGALRAGGVLVKFQPAEAGFDVANGSSDRIKLTANGGSLVYSLYVLGRHDDDVSSSSSSSSSTSSTSTSTSTSQSSSSTSTSSLSSTSTSTSSLSSTSTSSLSSTSSSSSSS